MIQIIREGVPEAQNVYHFPFFSYASIVDAEIRFCLQNTEEIEIDIDSLPTKTLIDLYNSVIQPLKTAQPTSTQTGKGTRTGGLS